MRTIDEMREAWRIATEAKGSCEFHCSESEYRYALLAPKMVPLLLEFVEWVSTHYGDIERHTYSCRMDGNHEYTWRQRGKVGTASTLFGLFLKVRQP